MDYTNDVNYNAIETAFKSFYYDSRYKPAFTQKRLKEAGYLGRKSGKGFILFTTTETKYKSSIGDDFYRILATSKWSSGRSLFKYCIKSVELAMKKCKLPKGLLMNMEIGLKKF